MEISLGAQIVNFHISWNIMLESFESKTSLSDSISKFKLYDAETVILRGN